FSDQLDRAFVSFRNACRDEQLDISARKSLLYLVELRAMHWQSSNNLNVYYEGTGDICMSASSSQITNAPLLLAPGEVLKPSGKFTSPTKMPGKNYCKDEVVIRNADSGKVMGIRGRRVHMIEELSETVISFQRGKIKTNRNNKQANNKQTRILIFNLPCTLLEPRYSVFFCCVRVHLPFC
ncbi:hypothetical protein AAG570_001944, partial [Ranatra chinensis]